MMTVMLWNRVAHRSVRSLLLVAALLAGVVVAVGDQGSNSSAHGLLEQSFDAEASGPIVAGASTPSGDGYWVTYADGSVEAAGDAEWFGDASDLPLNGPIQGMAATPSGEGYWLVAFDGGVFSYGDAAFHGSMGGSPLNAPIFSIAPTTTGAGYWLVAFDGGIFAFGDASFHGSMGGTPLNAPINGILSTPQVDGYLMVASDGGVFSFAPPDERPAFYGSLGGSGINDVVGLAPTPTNRGYWILRSNGVVVEFGDAADHGQRRARNGNRAIGIFANPSESGFRVLFSDGSSVGFGAAPGGGAQPEPAPDPDPQPGPAPDPQPGPGPDPSPAPDPGPLPFPVGDGLYPPTGDVDYFIVNDDDTPGRYPSCKPIDYVIDFSSAPPGAREALDDVLAELSAAGGYEFRFVGEVDASFDDWRRNPQVGDAFRPLLFTFKNGNEHGFGGAVGQGGSTARFDGSGGGWVLVSGAAVMKADVDYARLGSSVRAVILHEILHVLGLDHVGSTNEVMYPSLTSLDRMGPGDTWGAHALGRGSPCVDLAGGHRWANLGSAGAVG